MLECVAKSTDGISVFEVYDDDHDADLDLSDMASLANLYNFAPKLNQSEAELVSAECCIPEAVISELAECLSGPLPAPWVRGQIDPPTQPIDCALAIHCVAGFTAQLEPGDWLYQACAKTDYLVASQFLYCDSWQLSELPAAFECQGANVPGLSLFVLMDLDHDEDVDLLDFAVLQREVSD